MTALGEATRALDHATRNRRTWAKDVEVLELVELAHRRTGRRHRRDLYKNCTRVYGELVKADVRGDTRRMSFPQLQGQLYDTERAKADPDAMRTPLRRWLNLLQDAGLIEWGPRCHPGSRKFAGIQFTLLPVPELHSEAARGYSSVGAAIPLPGLERPRRRRETPEERKARRIRPWCRRGGRQGVARWVVGEGRNETLPLFFGRGKLSGLEPSPSGKAEKGQTRARVGALPSWLAAIGAAVPWPPGGQEDEADAIQRACHPERRAALRALRTAAASGGGFDALRRVGAAGAPVDVVALAAWSIAFPGLEPRLSVTRREQLRRSGLQLDRLLGAGAAAIQLVDWMAGSDVDAAQGLEPRTLSFYVADLKATSRQIRRHRRGRPPPRPHRPRGRA